MSADITHEILLQVTNRRDLFSLISCSHQYYDIFKLHPNSILRRVVCNETGILEEVFPYAWKALKLSAKLSSSLVLEDSLTVSMNPVCVGLLESAQSTVGDMAMLYSVRCKDSLTIQDTLTYQEACRVHTAAYIYWQYQAFWQGLLENEAKDYHDSSDDNNEDNQGTQFGVKDQASANQEILRQCMKFLLENSSRDLLWVDAFIGQFLVKDVEICMGPHLTNLMEAEMIDQGDYRLNEEQWICYALSRGPDHFGNWLEAVLQADAFVHPLLSRHTWLKDVLLHVIQQRCVDQEARASPENRLVLNVKTLTQTCQRCGEGPSSDLPFFYNVTNLAKFCDQWTSHFLPAYLGSNPVEMSRLRQRLYGTASNSMYRSFPVEIMTDVANQAADRAANSLSTSNSRGSELELSDDEGDDVYKWSPLDPLCFYCFRAVFVEFLYTWWLEERNSDRVEAHNFIEDCWWGRECRTQRRDAHATKLNHCCPRTR